MRGAIIGDIVGSIYEFDNIKTKDFPLFSEGCFFTDDTVMTCAVAHAAQMLDGMRDHGELDYDAFQDKCNKNYHLLGAEYPDRGYGSHFLDWIYDIDAPAYNSCGNGSAMRVSPVARIARNEEECLELAKRTALPSHDHPDGIAGACATALAVYLARMGRSKDDIRDAVSDYYDLSFTLDEIRPDYDWGALCSDTVPQAVVAFLESTSFEDAIRNAISIGGDSDTIAAITGPIAEAYYGGAPAAIWLQAQTYFKPNDFILKTERAFHRKYQTD